MSSPSDLPQLLEKLLSEEDGDSWRKGLLHPSTDLQGCVRRTCLDLGNADQKTPQPLEQTRKVLGRQLHAWLQNTLIEKAYEVETEVDVTEGLPDGWTGSADIILTARSDGSKWLVDLKTVASVQIYMADKQLERAQQKTNKDNGWPSIQYVWQISAYYWALKKMGQPVDRVAILFWPVDTYYDRAGRKHALAPRAVEIDPIPEEEVLAKMQSVDSAVSEWKTARESTGKTINFNLPEHLEPEQRLVPKPSAKNPERYELHQKLDWRCRYCPYFGVSCDPPYDDEHIGTYFFEDGRWIYKEEIPGTKPLVAP